jgi:predicted nucleic acid-binding protein
MVAVLFDTCILVDYLQGVDAARIEIDACNERPAISIVSRIELLVGAPGTAERSTQAFLARFAVLPLDDETADHAIRIRRERRLKLQDAIILATAVARNLTLITRDEKAFGDGGETVRIPYRL